VNGYLDSSNVLWGRTTIYGSQEDFNELATDVTSFALGANQEVFYLDSSNGSRSRTSIGLGSFLGIESL
jgi:hypothetical protein